MTNKEWTLTEVANLVNQPQHRLIYFCEKGVIKPDGQDASGRGSSRKFSARNLFEFEIALTLWKFHLPASMIRKVMLVLNSFQKTLKRSLPEFELPYSLVSPESPEIRAYLVDGSCLHFSINDRIDTTLIGGVDLDAENNIDLWREFTILNCEEDNSSKNSSILPTRSSRAFFEINLTQIAKDLLAELD